MVPDLACAIAPGAVVIDCRDLLAINKVPFGSVTGQIRVTGNSPVSASIWLLNYYTLHTTDRA